MPAVLLFGIPELKDAVGASGTDPEGLIPRAVRALIGDGFPFSTGDRINVDGGFHIRRL